MRTSRLRLGLALGGIALVVAACDSDDNDDFAGGINSLGDSFVQAFRADPNSEPVNAQDVDLTLTPFVEPFNPT